MPVLAAVGAVSAVAGLFSGIFGGVGKRDAAYAGADLTDQQADAQAKVNAEAERRLKLRDDQVIGSNQAAAFASGFAMDTGRPSEFRPTSTTQQYLQQMKSEYAQEERFMHEQDIRQIDMMHQSANVQRQAADAGLWGDVLGGAAGFAKSGFDLMKTLGVGQS